MPLGPVPNDYKWIIAAAIDEGVIEEEEICYSAGFTGEQYRALKNADLTYFSPTEKKVLDFIIDYFKKYNCDDIKKASHEEKAYKETETNQKISYKYATALSISLS